MSNNKNTYLNSKYNSENAEELDRNSVSKKEVYQFKLILLGDIAVGKSAILRRFIDDDFTSDYYCTVGVEFHVKTLSVNDNQEADLKIWDTCGEEKYRTITRQYYNNCDGVILVFDLTNKSSFIKLDSWIDDVVNNSPQDVSVVVVGNKKDLKDSIEVTPNMIKEYFDKKPELIYFESSALSGEGITQIFQEITKTLIQKKLDKIKTGIIADEIEENNTYNLNKHISTTNSEQHTKNKCC